MLSVTRVPDSAFVLDNPQSPIFLLHPTPSLAVTPALPSGGSTQRSAPPSCTLVLVPPLRRQNQHGLPRVLLPHSPLGFAPEGRKEASPKHRSDHALGGSVISPASESTGYSKGEINPSSFPGSLALWDGLFSPPRLGSSLTAASHLHLFFLTNHLIYLVWRAGSFPPGLEPVPLAGEAVLATGPPEGPSRHPTSSANPPFSRPLWLCSTIQSSASTSHFQPQ